MRERVRLAHDLHDGLLQRFQGLVLRFQAVANRLLPDDPTRELLEVALGQADEVLAEARDRIQDLRPHPGARNYLAESLAVLGEQLAVGRAVVFHTGVDGTAHRFSQQIVDTVYSIGREALLNAFRHAEATSIELVIICGATDLRLRICDDGRGIDPAVLDGASRYVHSGLQGMHERAARIGARLEINSHAGVGTEIELRVSARGPISDG